MYRCVNRFEVLFKIIAVFLCIGVTIVIVVMISNSEIEEEEQLDSIAFADNELFEFT